MARVDQARAQFMWATLGVWVLVAIFGAIAVALLTADLQRRFEALEAASARIGRGELQTPVRLSTRDELGRLGRHIDSMRLSLLAADIEDRRTAALQETRFAVTSAISEDRPLDESGSDLLSLLAGRTGSQCGALYVADYAGSPPTLRLSGSFAADASSVADPRQVFGVGLLGQVAQDREQRVFDAPAGYLSVASGLGGSSPAQIVMVPCVVGGRTIAVIELATLGRYSDDQRRPLSDIAPAVGSQIALALGRIRTQELLVESEARGEELRTQSEQLQAQGEELQSQHDELEAANRELESRSEELEGQRHALAAKNVDLGKSRKQLSQRTELLDRASRYKSEFLSKMSHELRTPSNAILILSERLAGNSDANLTDRQVEFADTILSCGKDLLELVNEVLDLSKVEAGKIDLECVPLDPRTLVATVERQFRPIAEKSGLGLECVVSPDVPNEITADRLRVEQILKNLMSNACKFSDSGSVTLTVSRAHSESASGPGDGEGTQSVRFDVTDTGSGISEGDLDLVFEPFRQLDSGHKRRHGGTGLGLSISRELARSMGGDLTVRSTVGEGSTFTLVLPASPRGGPSRPGVTERSPEPAGASLSSTAVHEERGPEESRAGVDDGTEIDARRRVLIVEQDPDEAASLGQMVSGQGIEIHTVESAAAAQRMASEVRFDCAVVDLNLPDMSGLDLIERLRAGTVLIACSDSDLTDSRRRALERLPNAAVIEGEGASERLTTEISAALDRVESSATPGLAKGSGAYDRDSVLAGRTVLIVDDDPRNVFSLASLLEHHEMVVLDAENGREALETLTGHPEVDIVPMDIMMPQMDGNETTRRIREQEKWRDLP